MWFLLSQLFQPCGQHGETVGAGAQARGGAQIQGAGEEGCLCTGREAGGGQEQAGQVEAPFVLTWGYLVFGARPI